MGKHTGHLLEQDCGGFLGERWFAAWASNVGGSVRVCPQSLALVCLSNLFCGSCLWHLEKVYRQKEMEMEHLVSGVGSNDWVVCLSLFLPSPYHNSQGRKPWYLFPVSTSP